MKLRGSLPPAETGQVRPVGAFAQEGSSYHWSSRLNVKSSCLSSNDYYYYSNSEEDRPATLGCSSGSGDGGVSVLIIIAAINSDDL